MKNRNEGAPRPARKIPTGRELERKRPAQIRRPVRVQRPDVKRSAPKKRRLGVKTIIARLVLVLVTAILFIAVSVYAVVFSVAHGPSDTIRNMLVLSAMQASATKWVPGLFLSDATVDEIVAASKEVTVEQIEIEDYTDDPDATGAEDVWAKSTDGILYETVNGSTFKGYVLLIRDPSQVFVATSSNYVGATAGMTLFTCAEKYNCLAAINGGEFTDTNGQGSGATPLGLTYAQGENVWNDAHSDRTFMGFDKSDRLIVSEGMTKARADELGIRDAVSFQTGNVLIDSSDGAVNVYYSDANNGTAQRTAIGQRADGTVIFLATDGRSTSSLGATRNDIIDIMIDYGAVSAGMLDGGSSTMMYYRDYAAKYGIDESTLDEYQKQGMVNKYKAFTTPRYIPTYFAVRGDG